MTFALITPPNTIVATGAYWPVLAAGAELDLVSLDRNCPRRGEPVVTPVLRRGVRMTVVAFDPVTAPQEADHA